MNLRGAEPSTVRTALDRRDPLPGTTGFAGLVDGRLVRDVLGRVPLYVDAAADSRDGGSVDPDADDAPGANAASEFVPDDAWAFEPGALDDPIPFPAGGVAPVADAVSAASGPKSDGTEPGSEGTEPGSDGTKPGNDGTGDGDDGGNERRIHRRWTLPDPDPFEDRAVAIETLAGAIRTAASAVPDGDVAVAFSGGVDSALVAELLDAPLYVVGFPDSHDVAAARSAADAMDRELTVVELEPADLERAVPTVARATGRTNAMDVSIALPLFLVAERVAADGFDRLALGQGADELFGGYEKVVRLDHRVDADTVRGAVREQIRTISDQLPRDVHAVRAAGVEPATPLLYDAVVDAASRLPDELLADERTRKKALRAVAADYLPAAVAEREKKALQYGSLVSRELDRLARQAGYKRRMDDHVGRYVESLLEADENR